MINFKTISDCLLKIKVYAHIFTKKYVAHVIRLIDF